DRLVDAHREHVADRFALERNGERLAVEARPAADVAQHLHVGQEAHLDALDALTLATAAAPVARVEREPAGIVAAHARLGRLGEQAPYGIPEADIGRGTRARRLADGGLIDFQHSLDRLP